MDFGIKQSTIVARPIYRQSRWKLVSQSQRSLAPSYCPKLLAKSISTSDTVGLNGSIRDWSQTYMPCDFLDFLVLRQRCCTLDKTRGNLLVDYSSSVKDYQDQNVQGFWDHSRFFKHPGDSNFLQPTTLTKFSIVDNLAISSNLLLDIYYVNYHLLSIYLIPILSTADNPTNCNEIVIDSRFYKSQISLIQSGRSFPTF